MPAGTPPAREGEAPAARRPAGPVSGPHGDERTRPCAPGPSPTTPTDDRGRSPAADGQRLRPAADGPRLQQTADGQRLRLTADSRQQTADGQGLRLTADGQGLRLRLRLRLTTDDQRLTTDDHTASAARRPSP
ncbi:hypothetical protein PV372_23815, partial [Streptomyces scabiei]|nr:hypothetical protein [Streptomyces scabiei]